MFTWYNSLMFRIITVKNAISLDELKELAHEGFEDIVKAVMDTKQGIMAVGGELHVDMQVELMEKEGSVNEDTWGINLYINESEENFIEYDSMINLKPILGNKSRDVEDENLKKKIKEIVDQLVKR